MTGRDARSVGDHAPNTGDAGAGGDMCPGTPPTGESPGRITRRQELERSVRRHSLDAAAYQELAKSYLDDGLKGEAKRVLKLATGVFPDDEAFRWELEEVTLATSLAHLREVRELTERLESAEVEAELVRAEADWAHRRLEVCRDRIDRNVRPAASRLQAAEALIDLDRHAEAVDVLEPLLDDPRSGGRANFLIGESRSAGGDDLGAMRAWRRAAFERRHPAEPGVRVAALRRLTTHAGRMGLIATLQDYDRRLASATGRSADGGRTTAADDNGRPERSDRSDEPLNDVGPVERSSK